jgi:hypothetical protein
MFITQERRLELSKVWKFWRSLSVLHKEEFCCSVIHCKEEIFVVMQNGYHTKESLKGVTYRTKRIVSTIHCKKIIFAAKQQMKEAFVYRKDENFVATRRNG